jgi:hypothetical protein
MTYDPTKLAINRKRFSTTQGEVELVYDGQRIEQYGDTITLDGDGHYRGHSDEYWHSVASDWLSDETAAPDLQRMVQVDGGEAVSLETFFKLNEGFTRQDQLSCVLQIEVGGAWRYPIGGGGFCTVTWATPRAALETEYRDWLHERGYEDDSVQNHLLWNHDLTDEDRAWLEGFTTRWLAMEEAERMGELANG